MKKEFRENSSNHTGEATPGEEVSTSRTREKSLFARWTETLLQIGLGESMLRAGSSILSLVAVIVVVWLVQMFYERSPQAPVSVAAAQSTAVPTLSVDSVPVPEDVTYDSIPRKALPHTIIPSRPRQDIVIYTVQEGDTVFGIADKFGLQPQTILWGNYNTLLDDPHSLTPGQDLVILPVDGVYHEWLGGISFGDWAKFFGVTAEDIINFPGNHIDPDTVGGDYNNASIPTGTYLIIPGGKREFASWSAPLGVTRENPASARVLGPGACEPVTGGAVGYGSFVWPTQKHYLSGYDYSPKTNHWGIDIAGQLGEGVFAVDAGVVVYAGWNNYGYGNMIIVDHGNGWQSLYAHLSELYRFCGQSVGQGEAIGAIGSTGHSSGPHLHFELMSPGYKVNPWDFLPPP